MDAIPWSLAEVRWSPMLFLGLPALLLLVGLAVAIWLFVRDGKAGPGRHRPREAGAGAGEPIIRNEGRES